MISNQILQSTIDGLKGITRIDICVMDTEGKVLATTIENAEQYENLDLAFSVVLTIDSGPVVAADVRICTKHACTNPESARCGD